MVNLQAAPTGRNEDWGPGPRQGQTVVSVSRRLGPASAQTQSLASQGQERAGTAAAGEDPGGPPPPRFVQTLGRCLALNTCA